jgi:hypothetical protein
MGIPEGTPLHFVGTFKHEDDRQISHHTCTWQQISSLCSGLRCRTWGGIYRCTYDGELKLQAEEVQAVLLMSAQEIFARQQEFTGKFRLLHFMKRRACQCRFCRGQFGGIAALHGVGDSVIPLPTEGAFQLML